MHLLLPVCTGLNIIPMERKQGNPSHPIRGKAKPEVANVAFIPTPEQDLIR